MRWSITIQYQCMTVSALAGFVCFVKSSNHLMSNYFHYSTQRYHLSLHVTCFEAVKFAFKPSKGPFHNWTGWTVGGIELSLCFREIAVVSVWHQQWRQQRISRVPRRWKSSAGQLWFSGMWPSELTRRTRASWTELMSDTETVDRAAR